MWHDNRNEPAEVAPDVLIVGAGPTGLALAALLRKFGVGFRLIDRAIDRAHESRALAVQARTLELFQSIGLGEALVERGNPSARLFLHFGGHNAVQVRLTDFGRTDTRFPFILFVSQARTEELLNEYLFEHGVAVERAVELVALASGAAAIHCRLRHSDGREEEIAIRYLAGCDGAHSTVRKLAGIPFEGDAYLQEFALGDVEVDGHLEAESLHSFARQGVAMFFPLGSPATWRVIAMSEGKARKLQRSAASGDLATNALPLEELQSLVDAATGGGFRVRDPAWLTHFRLHHRQAAHYRNDRVFLAGDAAHIHSPVGAQGMNTGIQDAWNLGWKLALVARGSAHAELLDSYEAERWPVGRFLLRYTDRLFATFVRVIGPSRVLAWIRRNVVGRILPSVLGSRAFRRRIFHFVSELGIHYRGSPIVLDGEPKIAGGISAGERLPDVRVVRNGRPSYLQQEVVGPHLSLLLCGALERWDRSHLDDLSNRYGNVFAVFHLVSDRAANRDGVLVDACGEAFSCLGINTAQLTAQYLIRPDGYIAFGCSGSNLRGGNRVSGAITDRRARSDLARQRSQSLMVAGQTPVVPDRSRRTSTLVPVVELRCTWALTWSRADRESGSDHPSQSKG